MLREPPRGHSDGLEAGAARPQAGVVARLVGNRTFVLACAGCSLLTLAGNGINLLLFQFQGGSAPACRDAADSDDSGRYNLTDAIIIFQYLFLGGSAPRAPSPSAANYAAGDCGVDPSDDDPLDCLSSGPSCSA